jgi:NAD(P)-dependent dehydrogenase (short-subunit alcohol dehydrogenase family)
MAPTSSSAGASWNCQAPADAINANPGSATGEAIAVPGDIVKKEELQAVVNAANQRWGRVDIVMANAAIHPWTGSVLDLPDATFNKFMQVNVQSTCGWGR